jgi:hypothetical protein
MAAASAHGLRATDLFSLEEYHRQRGEFRARVLAHKRNRQVSVGANATFYFEDRLTVQYQIQEMLRIERIFESEAIEDELAAYNPLIPDGANLKATFMIEFPDSGERREALQRLRGIEDAVYMQVEGQSRVAAIADEDLDRTDAEKTSAVHFVRFEFSAADIAALRRGSELVIGIDHPAYSYEVQLSANIRAALIADFD